MKRFVVFIYVFGGFLFLGASFSYDQHALCIDFGSEGRETLPGLDTLEQFVNIPTQ